MKRIFLISIAFCFVLTGNFAAVSQTRKVPKKTTRPNVLKKKETTGTNSLPDSGNINGLGSGIGAANGNGIGAANGTGIGTGTGNGVSGTVNTRRSSSVLSNSRTHNVKIISKPKAEYTAEARNNIIQGTVVLSVTFLNSGDIGKIVPVTNLPDGLTEKAVEAAKLLKFEPARKNGIPYTVTQNIDYNFILY